MPTVTKNGQLESLKLILSKNLLLRLFENNINPDYYNNVDDYEEARGGGYSQKILNASKWKFGFFVDEPIAVYPDQVFEFTGPVGLVYGFYVTGMDGKIIRWAERFADGPYEVLRAGDTVTVIPRTRMPRIDNPSKLV